MEWFHNRSVKVLAGDLYPSNLSLPQRPIPSLTPTPNYWNITGCQWWYTTLKSRTLVLPLVMDTARRFHNRLVVIKVSNIPRRSTKPLKMETKMNSVNPFAYCISPQIVWNSSCKWITSIEGSTKLYWSRLLTYIVGSQKFSQNPKWKPKLLPIPPVPFLSSIWKVSD